MMSIPRLFLIMLSLSWVTASAQSALFDTPWNDRSPYTNDLIPEAHAALETLVGAPVYHLELSLSENRGRVTGRAEVYVTNTASDLLDDLVFRFYPNALGAAMTVETVQVDGISVTPVLETGNTVLQVPLTSPLVPGESTVVSMRYTVTLLGDTRGYGRLARYDDALSLSSVYPVLSVYRDGAWATALPNPMGDPLVAEAAFYLVRVRAPANQQLVATGRMTAWELSGSEQVTTFAAGPAREFYLASLSDYVLLSRPAGETLVHSYVPADLIGEAEAPLDLAVQAVKLFSERFTPYPYRELEFVALPVSASGIEYPGVVLMATNLYRDTSGTFTSVIAHEVAHQWSYNLVGSDQIEEPWLDEALAQYLTLLYHRSYDSAAFVEGYLGYWNDLWRSAPDPDKPLGLPVAAYANGDYAEIVYGRGLFFFEALADLLDEDVMREILRTYYERNAWKFVDTETLQQVAEEVCACDLDEVFATWVGSATGTIP